MTDQNVGNTPDDPAPGGSNPGTPHPPTGGEGAPEAKPPEGEVKDDKKAEELPADEGNRTAVIPPREVLDLDATPAVPSTVVVPRDEAPELTDEARAVLDEGDEGGKTDEGPSEGTASDTTATGGGGEVPPSGGTETAQGGKDDDEKNSRAVAQITALIKAMLERIKSARPDLVAKAERNRDQVRRLLEQCRNKDLLIKMLKAAIKTGDASDLAALIDSLLKITTQLDELVNTLSGVYSDPVFDEAEAYLAAQKADGDVD